MKALGFNKKTFFQLTALVIGVHFISYTPLGNALSILFVIVGLILLVYAPSKSLSFFLVSIVTFDDINKYENGPPDLENIFTISFLGQSLSMVWSIIMFLIVILLLLFRKEKEGVPAPIVVILGFLFLGASRFYQYLNPMFSSDVAFVVNILLGFGIGIILLKSPEDIKSYFSLIVSIFIIKYIVNTIHAIILSANGVFYYFSGESAANFIIIPLAICLLILLNKRIVISQSERVLVVVFIVFIMSFLFIAISRERILFTCFMLIAFSIVYKRVNILAYFALIGILATVALFQFNPNMYSFVTWKLTTFLPNSSTGAANASSSVRLLELKNIIKEQILEPYKLFLGTGWGGYYSSEEFPFTKRLLGTHSYPDEWISDDKFYKPHGTYLYVLLKFGTVGFLVFYGSFIIYSLKNLFNKTIYKIKAVTNEPWALRYIQITLALTLPIVSLVIFTSKLQILTGFFLAMLFYANKALNNLAMQTDSEKESKQTLEI